MSEILSGCAVRAAIQQEAQSERARPLSEWHEDEGPVVWWRFCRDERPDEASWIGTPLDDDWPGYHTHWTPHPPIPTL